MSELHRVSDPGREAVADVIFVHGLGGDPFATWWHDEDQPKSSFPFWLAEDCPDVVVHTLAYDASPSKWLGSSMPLVDRATNVLTRFEAEGIGGRPLFFVCHSLGGLVVKQALRSALELGESGWRGIVDNTRGIVFLATPHTGARPADYLGALGKILRLSVTIGELEANAPALRDLNIWYRQKARDLGIDTLAMFETRDTRCVRVVDEASADAGQGVPRGLDADHFSICKPRARSDLVYGAVMDFLRKRLPESRPPPASKSRSALHYFISYSRRSDEDRMLAEELRTGLESAGHEVFIDQRMKVGTDWVEEITRRIDWCDGLVVLLSEASIHSEMMLGEVRMAHRKRRQDGRPHILPIRVRYEGPLDHELDSYLARFQYIRWDGNATTSHVLNDILEMAAPNTVGEVATSKFEPRPADLDPKRPEPSVRAFALRAPAGVIKPNDSFYIRRDADAVVEVLAALNGESLLIKATRQSGGSSLLQRYLAVCAQSGKAIAFVNMESAAETEISELTLTLQFVAREISRSLRFRLESEIKLKTPSDLTIFMEDQIIRNPESPLVLAFEEIDRVVGQNYQNDFFSMLRQWHNNRANYDSRWQNVDLAFVCRIEPYLLIDDPDRSLFNVMDVVEVGAFKRKHVDDLNTRYGGMLSPDELDNVYCLLGGHPYLTRLAFYRLASKQATSYQELERCAHDVNGPFGDHLRAVLFRLQQRNLLNAMQQAVMGRLPGDDLKYGYLHSEGLVVRDALRVVPSNLLYQRFFRSIV